MRGCRTKSHIMLELHNLSGNDLRAVGHLLNLVDSEETEAYVGSGECVVPGITAEMGILEVNH
jgi:hypothetical protein